MEPNRATRVFPKGPHQPIHKHESSTPMTPTVCPHAFKHLNRIGWGVGNGRIHQPFGQPTIPIPLEQVHVSNEGQLFHHGHIRSPSLLGFGTQDFGGQFGSQITSHPRQSPRSCVIGHDVVKESSPPLGAPLGTRTTRSLTLHGSDRLGTHPLLL